jgi:protease-4
VRDAAERGVGKRASARRLRASAFSAARALAGVALALLGLGCITIDLPLGGRGELQETVVAGTSGPKLLLLDVEGVLSEAEESGSLGLGGRESTVARVREQLERAREDDEIRGLLVRIDSPGGTVTASDILYREVLRFKEETKRPVIAQCMGVCASGGYYVAMAADSVRVHPTTVTGSIGVIFSGLSLAGLMEKLGVEDQTLKSGAFKDAGSPLRRMTDAERAQLQSVIDDLYGGFVEVVEKGRPGLAQGVVRALADGRVYSARQAKDAGLVDGLGYLPDAVDELKQRAGLEEARVIVYHRPRELRENLYSASASAQPRARRSLAAVLRAPGFLYLWWPAAQ